MKDQITWLTFEEIADKHGQSIHTLRRWSSKGKFKRRRRRGRKIEIPEEDYLEAIEIEPVEMPLSESDKRAMDIASEFYRKRAEKKLRDDTPDIVRRYDRKKYLQN